MIDPYTKLVFVSNAVHTWKLHTDSYVPGQWARACEGPVELCKWHPRDRDVFDWGRHAAVW
jgi:hypothetical protein